MGVLLDYHIQNELQHGYKVYTTNPAAFTYVFDGIAPGVLAEWYTTFCKYPPLIKGELDRGVDRFPFILVALEADSITNQPMGDQVFYDTDGRRVDQHLASQTVKITICAQTPTLLRMWYEILLHVLQVSTKKMLQAGYINFQVSGADDFNADVDAVGEQWGLAGVTTRSITCTGETQRDIKHWDEPGPTAKTFYVLASDETTVDGHPGGVAPKP